MDWRTCFLDDFFFVVTCFFFEVVFLYARFLCAGSNAIGAGGKFSLNRGKNVQTVILVGRRHMIRCT